MSDQRVVVEGADQLKRAMAKVDDACERAAEDAGTKVAEQVASTARAATPRLTGRLAGAVVVSHSDDGAEVTYGRGVAYAGWIEYGGTRGRPYSHEGRYFGPAVATAERDYVKETDTRLEREMEKLPWPK